MKNKISRHEERAQNHSMSKEGYETLRFPDMTEEYKVTELARMNLKNDDFRIYLQSTKALT